MANEKGKLEKHDKYTINMHDKYEIEYWSTKFRISAEELQKAVEEVGNSSINVKEHVMRKS
ncbi:hypothetical protein GCM10027049_22280 [Mucilaginibacter puniceus]